APASAEPEECNDKKGLDLKPGSETTDLEVTGLCTVKPGQTYTYRNVNIFRDRRMDPDRIYSGHLKFAEPGRGDQTHFFAQSIVIENHGILSAGTSTNPIGPEG